MAKNSRRGETRAKLPRFLDIDIFQYVQRFFFVFLQYFQLDIFTTSILPSHFISRYNMKTHYNTHHRDQNEVKSFKCLICPEAFFRREKLNEHLKLMHEAAIETTQAALNAD